MWLTNSRAVCSYVIRMSFPCLNNCLPFGHLRYINNANAETGIAFNLYHVTSKKLNGVFLRFSNNKSLLILNKHNMTS